MKNPPDVLDVKLRGREFRVACKPEERDSLMASVAYLDSRLAEMAEKTRSSGESLVLMTALNLAHELLAVKADANIDGQAVRRRIAAMGARLDAVLEQQESLF